MDCRTLLSWHPSPWLVILALFVTPLVPGRADTITWMNTGGGDWNQVANWDLNRVPASTDDVRITTAGTYTVSIAGSTTAVTVASLTLGGPSGKQTLSFNAKSLTLNSASTVNGNGILTFKGLLAGAGLLKVDGVLDWTDGKIESGGVSIGTIGFMDVRVGADAQTLHGWLTNAGTVTWSGNVYLSGGGIHNLAGGTLDVQRDVNFWSDRTTEPTVPRSVIRNEGTFRKSAGTGRIWVPSCSFHNAGIVDVQSGTLEVNDGTSQGGTFNAAAGATMLMANQYGFGPGCRFTGAGTNLWRNAIQLDGQVFSENVVWDGGWIMGTNVLSGIVTWRAGTINQSTVITIATNGILNIESGATAKTIQGTLINEGTVVCTGVNDVRMGSSRILNRATGMFDLRNDRGFVSDYGSPFFNNEGTLLKSAGSGTSTFSGVAFNNSGTLDVQSGAVSLAGGGGGNGNFNADIGGTLVFGNGYAVGNGGTLTGTGTNILSGGTFTLNGNLASSNTLLTGATLAGTSGVLGGVMIWKSGNIPASARLTVTADGVLEVAGTSGTGYDMSGALTNAGIVRLTSGNLILNTCNGGVGLLVNLPGALVELQSDLSINSGGCGSGTIDNRGTVRKSGGTGTSSIGPTFNNTGVLDIQTGSVSLNSGGSGNGAFLAAEGTTLRFGGGAHTVGEGGTIGGGGTNILAGGSLTMNGSGTAPNWVLSGGALAMNGGMTLSNGVLAGASLGGTNVSLSGVWTWKSGNIPASARLTVAADGVLELAGTSGTGYDMSGALTNAGIVRLTSGNLILNTCNGGVGQLVNLPGALVELQNDVSINSGGCSSGTIDNRGVVRKSGGTGMSTIGPAFNNTGTLEIQTGSVSLNSGGSGNGAFLAAEGTTLRFGGGVHAVGDGGTIGGGGTNILAGGSLTMNGSGTAPNWVLSGGALAMNGGMTLSNGVLAGASLGGTNVSLSGVWTWKSGSIPASARLTVTADGVLEVAGTSGTGYDMSGALTNAGIVRLTSGNLILNTCNGGVGLLVNLPGALVELQSDLSINSGGCGSGTIDNRGTVRKSGGTGTSSIGPAFNNTGTLDIQTGGVSLNSGGSGNGAFLAAEGTTLRFSGGAHTVGEGGTIGGGGTNILAGGSLTMNGSGTAPNWVLSTGTLAMNGSMTLSNGILAGASLGGTNVSLSGAWTWKSGNIPASARLTVATNGVLELAGTSGTGYDMSGALTNAGIVRLTSGNLILNTCNGGVGLLVNLPGALVELQSDLSINSGGCGSGTIDNRGTVRKSGGTGTSTIGPLFKNSGTLEVLAGTVRLNGGSGSGIFYTEAGTTLAFLTDYAATAGAIMTGAGTNLLSGGTFTLNTSATVSNLVLAGAALAGTNGIIDSVLIWKSGTIPAQTRLTVGRNGMLVLAGSNGTGYELSGVLTNAGVVRLTSGNLTLNTCNGGVGVLVNLPGALVELQSDLSINNGGCGSGTIDNRGTVRKSGGTGTSTINPVFKNSGTLFAQTGMVSLNGSYTLAGGTLHAGISSPSTFGRISLAGSAQLAGTLGAQFNAGYAPVAGHSFAVVSYGSKSGAFGALDLPPNASWQSSYGSTTFTLSIVNAAPVLASLADQALDELLPQTIDVIASDPDLPLNTLTFSLLSAPEGMTIDPVTGAIRWTPAEDQGPSTNTVVLCVTDDQVPPLSDTRAVTVVVNEWNSPPVLPIQTNRMVLCGAMMVVTNAALDPDVPANSLSYVLLDPPNGATIDTNGIITWTPALADAATTNVITTVATDFNPWAVNTQQGSVTNSFTVVARIVNHAPMLAPLQNWDVNPGQTISFTADATDQDIPVNPLTFSLPEAPAGAIIDPVSGLFTWRLPVAQADTTNLVRIRVTDMNPQDPLTTELSDTKSFAVVVRALLPVELTVVPSEGGLFALEISGVAGPDYVLQASGTLTNWLTLGTNTPTVLPFRYTDTNSLSFSNRYYRVLLGP